jgi:transposase
MTSSHFIDKQIVDIDDDLQKLIKKTPAWREADELLQSVPGVGPVLSSTLTALVPELGKLNRKEIAARRSCALQQRQRKG